MRKCRKIYVSSADRGSPAAFLHRVSVLCSPEVSLDPRVGNPASTFTFPLAASRILAKTLELSTLQCALFLRRDLVCFRFSFQGFGRNAGSFFALAASACSPRRQRADADRRRSPDRDIWNSMIRATTHVNRTVERRTRNEEGGHRAAGFHSPAVRPSRPNSAPYCAPCVFERASTRARLRSTAAYSLILRTKNKAFPVII